MVVFPVLAGIFIVHYGWRPAWAYLGFVVIIIALIPSLIFIYEEPRSLGIKLKNDENIKNNLVNFSLGEAARTKSLWIIAIGTGVLYFFHSGVNTHQAAFLQDRDISLGLSSLVISFNAISTGLGSIIWGLICDRVKIKYAFSGVFAFSMLALLTLIYTFDVYMAILASIFFGFAMGGMLAVPAVAYANYYGTDSLGKIRGITHPVTTAGAASGVMVSGIIFDIYSSYTSAFWIYFLMSIFMVFFSLFLDKPRNEMN
jgi:MFS family permease